MYGSMIHETMDESIDVSLDTYMLRSWVRLITPQVAGCNDLFFKKSSVRYSVAH